MLDLKKRNNKMLTSAIGVINRQLPDVFRDKLQLDIIPGSGAHEVYQVQSSQNCLLIKGSSAIAICRGFYDWLKKTGMGQITWSGRRIDMPQLPDYDTGLVTCPYQYRLYYNMCTFGYSTVWWDWERWEREIDWMALHGINMPLALVGQEAIWQMVWESFGVAKGSLDNYFTGPAFLPWHRCGNINRYDGPLPQQWIDKKKQLQRKILQRMRSLGMKPVVPAFSGFVPSAIKEIYPDQQVYNISGWAQLEDKYQTFLLSPYSELFKDIGKKFIELYQQQYGAAEYYIADSFNEVVLPDLTDKDKQSVLADFGSAVYNSIKAGNLNGKWLMQGWMFYFHNQFWTKRDVEALLSKVPDDDLIIIDLGNEIYQGYKEHNCFHGKKWIFSFIHNFGGNNALNGGLELLNNRSADILKNETENKNLLGFGISPEGIENNEVVYELLTDIAWSERPVDIKKWLQQYCLSRYGNCSEKIEQVWDLLLSSAYSQCNTNIRHAFQSKPKDMQKCIVDKSDAYFNAVKLFIDCEKKQSKSTFYQSDLIEMVVQAAGIMIDSKLLSAVEHLNNKEFIEAEEKQKSAFKMLEMIDALLNTRKDMQLENWIQNAQKWAVDDNQRKYYTNNALKLVTVWAGPILSDYSARLWSGLIRDYYLPRWKYFLETLKESKEYDIETWQQNRISKYLDIATKPDQIDNVIDEAKAIFSIVWAWHKSKETLLAEKKNNVGRWEISTSSDNQNLKCDVTDYLFTSGFYTFVFESDDIMPDINSFVLLENRQKIAEAVLSENNKKYSKFIVELKNKKPGASYSIYIDIKASRETAGDIYLVTS